MPVNCCITVTAKEPLLGFVCKWHNGEEWNITPAPTSLPHCVLESGDYSSLPHRQQWRKCIKNCHMMIVIPRDQRFQNCLTSGRNVGCKIHHSQDVLHFISLFTPNFYLLFISRL